MFHMLYPGHLLVYMATKLNRDVFLLHFAEATEPESVAKLVTRVFSSVPAKIFAPEASPKSPSSSPAS
jgi:hypothetical protein